MKVASKLLNIKLDIEDEENEVKMREADQNFGVREGLLAKGGLNVSHIAGTINQFEKERLQRLIFRATRGTALIYYQDIVQPFIDYRGGKTNKTVYIIIYQEGDYYTQKLLKILSSFLSKTYMLDKINFQNQINEITKKIKEFEKNIET